MKEKFWRKISYNERLFLAADDMCPPLVNQMLHEGSGVLDKNKWQQAVKTASDANPGSRLALRGCLNMSRWVDTGKTPPVIEVDGSTWDATGPEGAPFLTKRLHPRDGHTCEVVLIQGETPRVCFRTHHAVMDGRGTVAWIDDIYRSLRGEAPEGNTSTISDLDLARSYQKMYRTPYPRDSIAPTGTARGNEQGTTWRKISIQGRYKNFLGQAAVIVAREAWKHGNGRVLLGIPVDLRFRRPDIRSTGNLSIAIYVEVKPETTPEDFANEIKRQVMLKHDGMIDRFDPLLRFVPHRVMVRQGRNMIQQYQSTGKYGLSGMLTNLGRISIGHLHGGGYTVKTALAIPPGLETVPFFLGTASFENNEVVLILTMPKVLASNGRLEAILDTIAKDLVAE